MTKDDYAIEQFCEAWLWDLRLLRVMQGKAVAG